MNLLVSHEIATPSPEQQRVIDTWGKGMAVLAGAGSGKTTTLVAKCARLVELQPHSRFVAVSFTERSTSDLRVKLAEKLLKISEPGGFNQNWMMTIHGLCGAIIREYPREAGLDGEENVLAEAEAQILWERAIDALWLETLSEDVKYSLEKLLDRESRDGLSDLLKRVRDLFSFGVLKFLESSEDLDTRALAQVSRFVMERYDRLKWRQGSIDFNDLERGADRALNSPRVREAYHRRFDLVLVDEFQDTNPVQARIIWRFARPDSSNLCVVGDPKQSIYRFRDADVSAFEEFCSRLPVQQSLTWNFRSRPEILDFANQICERTFNVSEMNFEALIPKRDSLPGTQTVIRLDLESPAELGKWIQSEVARGTPLHEMALLVRKIRGNEKWLKALSSCGIPIAVGSGGLFWEDPRVREMVAFLKWWDNPANSLSGAIFLRAPWMKISDHQLENWLKQDPTFRDAFFASEHPISRQLKPFFNQTARPGQLLMALLVNQEVEDELGAPLLGLWHRVEELSSRGLDFHAVVAELVIAVEEKRREREVPAPRNMGQLSVLTLHGAKGLEFPHVILIDFGAKARTADSPLLFWDRELGAFLGGRDENGDRDKKNKLEMSWRELEKKKNLAESKRLFYVALTRARERLVLVCPRMENEEEFESEKVFLEDDWRGWIECSGLDIPRVQSESVKCTTQTHAANSMRAPKNFNSPDLEGHNPSIRTFDSTKQQFTRARHSVTEWTLLSRCPRAYEWTFIRPVLVIEEVSEVDPSTGAEAMPALVEEPFSVEEIQTVRLPRSELGTRVHAFLENGNFELLRELEKEVGPSQFIAEPLVRWATRSHWMVPADPENGRDVWTELPFEVPLGNEILVGSIDRLVLDKNRDGPQYSIIDFKVTDGSKQSEYLLEAYQIQMELYAWALTRLDPSIDLENIEAVLVNISRRTVQIISVDLGNLNLEGLLELSRKIVNGAAGEPRPGPLCSVCDFRFQCDASIAPVKDPTLP
jgi:ATP-dependent helicase/nuclease subunit A